MGKWVFRGEEAQKELSSVDPEVKRNVIHMTEATSAKPRFVGLLDRLKYFSSWYRAKRAVAVCLKFIGLLKARK